MSHKRRPINYHITSTTGYERLLTLSTARLNQHLQKNNSHCIVNKGMIEANWDKPLGDMAYYHTDPELATDL